MPAINLQSNFREQRDEDSLDAFLEDDSYRSTTQAHKESNIISE